MTDTVRPVAATTSLAVPAQDPVGMCSAGEGGRFQDCESGTYHWVIREGGRGAEIGSVDATVTVRETLNPTSTEWDATVGVNFLSMTGVAASGTTATINAECHGDCSAPATAPVAGRPVQQGSTIAEPVHFTSTPLIHGVGTGRQTINMILTNPAAPTTIGSTAGDPRTELGPVRCDDTLVDDNDQKQPAGCVTLALPTMVYSKARTPNIARHIELAQGSGLPGKSAAAPLSRNSNQTLKRANGSLACPAGKLPAKPAFSCDEYPFRSTQQGLAFPGPQQRRSFDGCSFDAAFALPRMTGPGGVSVCMVPAKEQTSQGGTVSGFYSKYRLLDGDKFLVAVAP
ncbi:NucA/NucB deoxyribonuclease domain-containing protein [Pseudonocardia sp. CA-107938]|uniref:NucA/NucB deoxyribonuclease domain-containing protein n=1 Tax=Pseudonocardia sp. CA-107938 TaxID=3240021 RepID=UPI003D8AF116